MSHKYTTVYKKPRLCKKGTSKAYCITLNDGKLSTVNNQKYNVNAPLGLLLRDTLKIKNTTSQLRKLLKTKTVTVNGKPVKSVKYPVTVLDVISYADKHYRILINANEFTYEVITEPTLFSKIIGVKRAKKGVLQVNAINGYNYYSTDSTVYSKTVICQNLITKAISYLTFTDCKKFVIIKGKYKGFSGLLSQTKVDANYIVINNNTQVVWTYVLVYN